MGDERIPVLWLYGPSGAGKSVVAFRVYSELARSGTRLAFADIDQLGICYPEPPDDPGRYRLKNRNLAAVAANARRAGCAGLVVSGVVDPSGGPSRTIPGVRLTRVRLRASHDEIRRRLGLRRESPGFVAGALREADELEALSVPDTCVDTDGLTVPEVAALVRGAVGDWPGPAGDPGSDVPGADVPGADVPGAAADGADAEVLLVIGAAGVGKSAVGFEVYLRLLGDGHTAAYLDLDQIGFCSFSPQDDPGNHWLKARNLAAIWRAYHVAGARRLVVTGPVSSEHVLGVYAGALPSARLLVCRLHAGPGELARRISMRGQGLGWAQPGDPLIGQPEAFLRMAAARAAGEAEALELSGLGDFCIDTGGLSVSEAADLIIARAGLLSAGCPDREALRMPA